jgi:hypothetical protein
MTTPFPTFPLGGNKKGGKYEQNEKIMKIRKSYIVVLIYEKFRGYKRKTPHRK